VLIPVAYVGCGVGMGSDEPSVDVDEVVVHDTDAATRSTRQALIERAIRGIVACGSDDIQTDSED